MTACIALLRGINVGGHAKLAMSDLREMVVRLGFTDVRTLLQTGNLVFRGNMRNAGELEEMLERAAADRLGLRTDIFVRSLDEWTEIIAANPFSDEAARDPRHLVLMALKAAPGARSVEALRAAITGPETVQADGRHLYITYPAGIGRSKLTNTVIEGRLGTRGTGRNWNTVLKLAALAHSDGG